MKKRGYRTITVDGQKYLWKVEHLHIQEYRLSKCVERVSIFKENHKQSPLRLWFREEDNLLLGKKIEFEKWQVGYSSKGEIWHFEQRKTPNAETMVINLNRPVVIAELIAYFLGNQWQPAIKKPCEIKNALTYLEKITLTSGH